MKEIKNIETYIAAHRDEFDDERPSLKVWANIERGLKEERKLVKNRKLIWRSVAATLLLLVGVSLGLMIYPRLQEQLALQALNETTELDEIETFFVREVDTRLVALTTLGIDQESQQSLADTDQEIKKLKLDLIYAPKSSREDIMQAIIATYESKVYILQTILERVSPIKNIHDESTIL